MEKRSGATLLIVLIIGMFLISNKEYDGTVVYNMSNGERNISADGYNIGKRGQCVEFIKRYYYEQYNHKMPNSYGHAINFFSPKIKEGKINPDRGLIQYSRDSIHLLEKGDILIFDSTPYNKYGHVAIVRSVFNDYLFTVQQNSLSYIGFTTKMNKRILGFLKHPTK